MPGPPGGDASTDVDCNPEERWDAHVGRYSMLGSFSAPPLLCAAATSRPSHFAAMPCISLREPEPHRPRNLREYARQFPYTACVARPVQRKEVASNPKAKQSMTNEGQRLRDQNVWDEADVREWDDVRDEAQREGFDVHMGYLLGICVEKNSELPENDPARKFKGRVVFQGNRVVDQNYDAAMFQDLGSAPATMEASKIGDFYGCVPGHSLEIADAVQAYVQADMKGTPTWVCLPPDQRPAAWKHMRKPVCRMRKALYGHPRRWYLLGR